MTPKFAGLSQALGAMRHEVESMAQDLVAEIATVRTDASDAFGQAKQEVAKTKAAVADVKAFVADLQGSNGGPTLSDSSDTSGQSPAASPEHLTVNGVSAS
jgi:hypothetical protein